MSVTQRHVVVRIPSSCNMEYEHPDIILEWIKKTMEEVPEEFRESAELVQDYPDKYSKHMSFFIEYDRPETEEEYNKRVDEDRQKAKVRYDHLKKHYGFD